MVSQKLLKEKPKAVAGLVRALNRAIIETAGATDAAIASMMKIEPLMNATLEKQRLLYAFKTHFVTPETAEIGVGDIKEERMAKAIKLLAETYGLAHVPTVASVFDRSFLPPKDARCSSSTCSLVWGWANRCDGASHRSSVAAAENASDPALADRTVAISDGRVTAVERATVGAGRTLAAACTRQCARSRARGAAEVQVCSFYVPLEAWLPYLVPISALYSVARLGGLVRADRPRRRRLSDGAL